MSDIRDLTKKINKWVHDRGMEKYQKPKDLALSLTLEAAEVLEHFQWKGEREYRKHLKENKDEFASELADVAVYLFKLADKVGVDLGAAIEKKLKKASKKYPVGKIKKDKNLKNYFKIKKDHRK